MAYKTKTPVSQEAQRDDTNDEFVIERREIVGKVRLTDTGSRSAVSVALDIVGSYLSEQLTERNDISVEFTIPGQHTFTVSAVHDAQYDEPTGRNDATGEFTYDR